MTQIETKFRITKAAYKALPPNKKRNHRGQRQVLVINTQTKKTYWQTVIWLE